MGNYLEMRGRPSTFEWRWQKRTEELIRFFYTIKRKEVNRVLDIGCSDGRNAEYFIKKACKKTHVYGIDIRKHLIEYWTNRSNPERSFFPTLANAHEIPFLNESFDLVILLATIEHVNEDLTLKECYRVLRKGGYIFLTLANPFHVNVSRRLFGWNDHSEYHLGSLAKLLRKYKFTIVDSGGFMFLPLRSTRTFSNFIDRNFNKFLSNQYFTICSNQFIYGKK